jgi:hypothetical protein
MNKQSDTRKSKTLVVELQQIFSKILTGVGIIFFILSKKVWTIKQILFIQGIKNGCLPDHHGWIY